MDDVQWVIDRWQRRLPDDPHTAAAVVLSRQAAPPVRRFERCVVVATPANVAGARAAAELPPAPMTGYGLLELKVSDDGESCAPVADKVCELDDIVEIARQIGDGVWVVFGASAFAALERAGIPRPDPARIIDLCADWFMIVRPELDDTANYTTAHFAVPVEFSETDSALASTARWLAAILTNHLLHCPFGNFSVLDDPVGEAYGELTRAMRTVHCDLTGDDRLNAAQVLAKLAKLSTAGQ